MRYVIFALTVALVVPALVFAERRHPPINKKTLVGTWEAISEGDTRVWRMEIREKGDSYLSFASTGLRWVYRLEKMEVKNDEVFLSFVDTKDSTEKIYVQGKGVAGRDGIGKDEGVIDTELIMNPDEKPLSKWKLIFVKTPYVEELYKLSKSAEKAIREIESPRGMRGSRRKH